MRDPNSIEALVSARSLIETIGPKDYVESGAAVDVAIATKHDRLPRSLNYLMKIVAVNRDRSAEFR